MGQPDDDGCVLPSTVPAELVGRYSPARDPFAERDVASYVEGQASDESVQHVERVRSEPVLGTIYEMWDVVTDKGRWWVLSPPTNLYSQSHFPSLDFTLSFHIGLAARLRERDSEASHNGAFTEVERQVEQARALYERAVEVEEFQAVGMSLREALISMVSAFRRRSSLEIVGTAPKDADFVAWSSLLIGHYCSGGSSKELRKFLRAATKDVWQLVNWLTHARNATPAACGIAMHSCDTVFGHLATAWDESRHERVTCPICRSNKMRSHFDIGIEPDGDYFSSCGACGWHDHP